ncbi:MAG: class I SAM-dependent RNA methyltransferase [Syntrophorhabdales bacterium]|jgi:putative N6-adenine-specific DNA methylase
MADYTLIATAAFGVEAVVADELKALGYGELVVENGRVSFPGDAKDIARCNIGLRTADRLLLRMAEFEATDFGELFERTRDVPWEALIPADGRMHVIGKSVRSRLFSVPDCQAIVKKAVVEAMKRRYHGAWFPETGPLYRIEVALVRDHATLTVDTSGAGLHKRGYRTASGDAPLKETLAAALVRLSRWEPQREFADPLAGSGTIAIEAALMGRNMAPGIRRSFVSEEWPFMPKTLWEEARSDARSRESRERLRIRASDADGRVLRIARRNAEAAGVADTISFQKLPLAEFRSSRKHGCIVSNPPYGERTGEAAQVQRLLRAMGDVYRSLDGWSLFALSPDAHFERLFGRKADRKRKLYNGNILCYLYQYRG